MISNLFKSIIVILAAGFMLNACSGKEQKKFGSLQDMTEDAKKSVDFISTDELKASMDAGDSFYLIDCREPEEFDSACITSAINIPRGMLEAQVSEKAPDHRKTVIIYCSNGDRSALSAVALSLLKYSSVKVLEGGSEAWKIKFPDLMEIHPVRGDVKSKAPAKSSGGCGG